MVNAVGDAVIDVGAQRVQRHAAFAIPFHARDFGAAETARAVDTNALGAETHRRLHRALHGAAERDAALELLGDRFGDQLRVELGLADFDDVDDDVGIGDLGDLAAQLVDVGALLADHHARTRRMDRHAALLVRTLDHDAGDTAACLSSFFRSSRILTSSCSSLPYSFLPANQRESHVRLMPRRSPIGLIF